jgi:D-alanyl-D-alanine carboxypeptidase
MVGVAEAAGRVGEPGGGFHYSNTNYVLLGELITRVTSRPWFDAVRDRILVPLDMRSTGLVGVNMAPGFIPAGDTFVEFDTSSVHPSLGGAAGGMQSTAADLLVFAEAMADGRLLSESSRAEMQSFVPGDDLSAFGIVHTYGLGFESYAGDGLVAYGHLGGGAAHNAFVGFDRDTGTAVVAMINANVDGPQGIIAFEALMAAKS